MAFDYFIKIDGIEGNSNIKGHKGEIDVLSFSWGVRQEGDGGIGSGGGAGKATAADFNFLIESGAASPELALSVCRGEHIKEALFSAIESRAGGKKVQAAFLKIKFNDCLISSYNVGGQGAGTPTESISMNFAKVEMEYEDETGQGKVSFCDFKKNIGG